jgi:hypothetical protein
MSDDTYERTDYGFMWGNMEVTRMWRRHGGGRVLGVAVGKRRLQVYVSEGGRSVRVWDGSRELR